MKTLGIILAAALVAVGAQAELLATWSINDWMSMPAGIGDTDLSRSGDDAYVALYDDSEFDWLDFGAMNESNVGQTFFPLASDGFFLDHLTDGVNSVFTSYGWGDGVAAISSNSEANLFGSSPYSLNGIDFAGYTIEAVSFTLEFCDAGIFSMPIEDWGEPEPVILYYEHESYVAVAGTYSFYGEAIPEPASATLMAFVSCGFVFLRRLFPAV